MIWYITKKTTDKQKKNAAGKAPSDISAICDEMGMRPLNFPVFPEHWKSDKLQKAWIVYFGTKAWKMAEKQVEEGDMIIFQYPFYGNRIIKKMVKQIKEKKHCLFIMLIHDLESLRNQNGQELDRGRSARGLYAEREILPLMDEIICHNDVMKAYLVSSGIPEEKLISLQIFDYLTEAEPSKKEKMGNSKIPSVVIAGNLAINKSAYLYTIPTKRNELSVHLYGIGFDEKKGPESAIYHGAFPPERLPEILEGEFGLVWDGISSETCAGGTGEYLRYNNPHKASLYLASNLPIIAWEESALAKFVREKQIGITVTSIGEIPGKIQSLSEDQKKTMLLNVREEGKKLRKGYYTKKAFEEAFLRLGRKL